MNTDKKQKKKLPGMFWLVVVFEFFERGAYYGMMSFISVYFTDTLNIPKENVGIIKGVIQPLLYFMPIISGAIADRFGYRKVLMVAFALLGSGYFLTSQMTEYTAVFIALVVMGFGAGTFKPIISGTIAKITDDTNSTQAFGIFYWTINLGAFLFPLFLVPFLKAIDPSYVIIASAICTSAMLIPTALFFKDPTQRKEADEKIDKRNQMTILQTLANSFEIIYSPVVLLQKRAAKSSAGKIVIWGILVALLGYSIYSYLDTRRAEASYPTVTLKGNGVTLHYKVDRNMSSPDFFKLESEGDVVSLDIYKPDRLDQFSDALVTKLSSFEGLRNIDEEKLRALHVQSDDKITLTMEHAGSISTDFEIKKISDQGFEILLRDPSSFEQNADSILAGLHEHIATQGITRGDLDTLRDQFDSRPFFLFFVATLFLIGMVISIASSQKPGVEGNKSGATTLAKLLVPAMIVALWLLPGIGVLGKTIATVIYVSITSLFIIDKEDASKFKDHAKFLLMIFLYSGFWVLYFQMFDSVLWYVKAYVDATSLNTAVNSFLGLFGVNINWFFDVEHVTVINAGVIIMLQLIISAIVKNLRAMPTLITGFAIATLGMGLLALSTSIWIFMLGIMLFSIGEMTAHPKFISYIGLTAPSDKKAMYMGYLFLYGVFGASIGGVLGAKLYVHFVDNLNQPRTLWLTFSSIGIVTIISLLLYDKFLSPKDSASAK